MLARWLSVSLVVTVTMVGWAWCQRVEKDGLGDDQYHADNDHRHPPPANDKDLQYMVTEEVYFDIKIANRTEQDQPQYGRFTVACFGEITPITCLNFVALAKGHRKGRQLLTYKGTPLHRIVRDFVVQMGDVTGNRGRNGKSIYGDTFEDENFSLSHRGAGWVAMANHGKDTNASQFFVLLQPARWLDGKHVVFGKVVKGMDLIRKIGEMETYVSGRPKVEITIEDCGVVGIANRYQLSATDVMFSDDISTK